MPRTQDQAKHYIDEKSTRDSGGHLIYSGPASLNYGFKLQTVPRIYWQLAYGPIPAGRFLLQTCQIPGCIEPDHWAISHSPHTVATAPAASPAIARAVKALRQSHDRQGAALAALEAAIEDS